MIVDLLMIIEVDDVAEHDQRGVDVNLKFGQGLDQALCLGFASYGKRVSEYSWSCPSTMLAYG